MFDCFVTDLSVLCEHTGGHFRVLFHKLVHRVSCDLGTSVSKVHEGLETRIRLPENRVSVARNHSPRLQDAPEVLVHVGLGELLADSFLHVKNESEHLLGRKTVERTSQTLKTGAVA